MRAVKLAALLVPFLILSALFSGCAAGAGIRIGVCEPITGSSAAGGQMTWEGIKLANEMYPEVLGRKVHLYLEDNRTDTAEAADAVTRLIDQQGVVAILGSYGPSLLAAGCAVARDRRIPVVGSSPADQRLATIDDYCFRVCFADPYQGRVMAKYAFDKGARTAVIIKDQEDGYALSLAGLFRESFIELTGDPKCVLDEFEYNTGDHDFTSDLLEVARLEPDVVFAPDNYGDSARLVRQARTLGIDAPFLGGDNWEAPEFIKIGGEAVEGAVLSTHYSAQAAPTASARKFADAYRKKYAKEPSAFAALGYDAYLAVIEAIKTAGKAEPTLIRDSLARLNGLEGATGTITMDTTHDASKSAIILQVSGGKLEYLTTIEPF